MGLRFIVPLAVIVLDAEIGLGHRAADERFKEFGLEPCVEPGSFARGGFLRRFDRRDRVCDTGLRGWRRGAGCQKQYGGDGGVGSRHGRLRIK